VEKEVLRMEKIYKKFPGVYALQNVNLNLYSGEVHALVGENGAGKSTLMNVLSGMIKLDSGEIYIEGVKKDILSPTDALASSIGLVPQELNIIPEISIAENIYLGLQNKEKSFRIDWNDTYAKAGKIMRDLGVDIDVRQKAYTCSVAQLQFVQIARILAFGAKILILDEPTASLTFQECKDLFEIINKLKANGTGIIFISHHLEEVIEIADRVTVMRDGEKVDTKNLADTNIKEIISKMAGQEVIFSKFDRDFESDTVVLEVKDLCRENEFNNVSFSVKKGEIFGIGGLVGAGRTEVMLTLFGAYPADSGSVYINQKKAKIKSPKDAIELGIGYLPEERRAQGIFPEMSIRENLTMPVLSKLFHHGVINRKEQNKITEKYIDYLEIKTPSIEKEIRDLSGGNQQKVIFGRWIERDLDILLLDEPTRGIDVRAKEEIHKLINSLASEGKTIVVVSSEIEELINICDRIMVMNEGRVTGVLDAKSVNQKDILDLALN